MFFSDLEVSVKPPFVNSLCFGLLVVSEDIMLENFWLFGSRVKKDFPLLVALIISSLHSLGRRCPQVGRLHLLVSCHSPRIRLCVVS